MSSVRTVRRRSVWRGGERPLIRGDGFPRGPNVLQSEQSAGSHEIVTWLINKCRVAYSWGKDLRLVVVGLNMIRDFDEADKFDCLHLSLVRREHPSVHIFPIVTFISFACHSKRRVPTCAKYYLVAPAHHRDAQHQRANATRHSNRWIDPCHISIAGGRKALRRKVSLWDSPGELPPKDKL